MNNKTWGMGMELTGNKELSGKRLAALVFSVIAIGMMLSGCGTTHRSGYNKKAASKTEFVKIGSERLARIAIEGPVLIGSDIHVSVKSYMEQRYEEQSWDVIERRKVVYTEPDIVAAVFVVPCLVKASACLGDHHDYSTGDTHRANIKSTGRARSDERAIPFDGILTVRSHIRYGEQTPISMSQKSLKLDKGRASIPFGILADSNFMPDVVEIEAEVTYKDVNSKSKLEIKKTDLQAARLDIPGWNSEEIMLAIRTSPAAAKEAIDKSKGRKVVPGYRAGYTPGADGMIDFAIKSNAAGLVGSLLELGFDPALVNERGENALMSAAAIGDKRSIELLVARKVPLDMQDANGKTALHRALEGGHEAVALSLIDAGASVNIADKSGKTAARYAAASGRKKIAQEVTTRLQEKKNQEAANEISQWLSK